MTATVTDLAQRRKGRPATLHVNHMAQVAALCTGVVESLSQLTNAELDAEIRGVTDALAADPDTFAGYLLQDIYDFAKAKRAKPFDEVAFARNHPEEDFPF